MRINACKLSVISGSNTKDVLNNHKNDNMGLHAIEIENPSKNQ